MALIACPNCGKSISDKAKTCPKCGYVRGNEELNNHHNKSKESLVKRSSYESIREGSQEHHSEYESRDTLPIADTFSESQFYEKTEEKNPQKLFLTLLSIGIIGYVIALTIGFAIHARTFAIITGASTIFFLIGAFGGTYKITKPLLVSIGGWSYIILYILYIACQISFDKFEEIFDLHFILICSVPPIALFLVVYLIFTNIASAKTKICLTSGSIALAIAAIFISYTAYHWGLDHYDDNRVDEIGVRNESVTITASFIESINQYDEVYGFSEGLAVVKKDGKYGFINTNGEEVIPCRYDFARSFSEGLADVEKDRKYGFINTKGEEVIPCKYEYVQSFSNGFAAVQKDYKWGYINTQGEEVCPCKYDYAFDFSEGFAQVIKEDKVGLINAKGEEVIPCKYDPYDIVGFSEGFASVLKDREYGFINTKGEEVIPFIYDAAYVFSEGLAMVVKDKKCGFINTKGEEVIPCRYDFDFDFEYKFGYAGKFSEGLTSVRKDDKWGYINTKGEEVIPFIYDAAYAFSEGLASVQKNDKWGFINTKGVEVIPYRYDEVESFHDGLARVKKDGVYGFTDIKGNDTFSGQNY